jgi:outer membrane protein assembly factor BamB
MKRRWIVIGLCGVLTFAALMIFLRGRSPVPIVWKVSIKAPGAPEIAMSSDGGIYANAGGHLKAFDRAGRLRWTSSEGIWIDSAPVIGGNGTIYVREKKIQFKDAIGGTNAGLLALHSDGTVKWRFPLSGIEGRSLEGSFGLDSNDTVYFTAGGDFFSPKALFAVSANGQELWRYQSTNNMTAPVEIANDGSVLFLSRDSKKSELVRFDAQGIRNGYYRQEGENGSSFSVDWEGVVYLPGSRTNTMTAIGRDGTVRWRFNSLLSAYLAPTIGPDGSLYFTAAGLGGPHFLVALSKDGKLKWQLPLGTHWCFNPPAVALDGSLYLVTAEPKLTAVNPNGTVRWTFQPPRRFSRRRPVNWKEFKRLLNENFRDGMNVFTAPPTLTPDGILCVCFGSPYDVMYALNVGVGLATNSPWPLKGGDLRQTRRVAPF